MLYNIIFTKQLNSPFLIILNNASIIDLEILENKLNNNYLIKQLTLAFMRPYTPTIPKPNT